MTSHRLRTSLTVVIFLAACGAAWAASYTTNTFDTTTQGWSDPGGLLSVSQNSPGGNPGGYLAGSFTASFIPQTETIRNTGADFTGVYTALSPTFAGWSFDFYADDFVPSLLFRFSGAAYTFTRVLTPQVGGVDGWYSVLVSADYSGSWLGGNAINFNDALGAVSYVELELTQAGTGAEAYRIDNFGTYGQGAGPEPTGSIPEPSTVALYGPAVLGLVLWRRHLVRLGCLT